MHCTLTSDVTLHIRANMFGHNRNDECTASIYRFSPSHRSFASRRLDSPRFVPPGALSPTLRAAAASPRRSGSSRLRLRPLADQGPAERPQATSRDLAPRGGRGHPSAPLADQPDRPHVGAQRLRVRLRSRLRLRSRRRSAKRGDGGDENGGGGLSSAGSPSSEVATSCGGRTKMTGPRWTGIAAAAVRVITTT